MKTIILAAGQGTRLGELTKGQFAPGQLAQGQPKALVKVAGTPLIDYSLKFLDQQPSNQVIVVGGYAFPILKRHLDGFPQVRLLENKEFHLGSILTLKTAQDFLDDETLIMNADHIYPHHFLPKLLQTPGDLVAACDFDRPLVADDMKIQEGPQGFVKAISKQLTETHGGYIGMTLVRRGGLARYREALQEVWKEDKKAAVEVVLQRLIDRGHPPQIADLSGDRWYEIDTAEDLQKAEQSLS